VTNPDLPRLLGAFAHAQHDLAAFYSDLGDFRSAERSRRLRDAANLIRLDLIEAPVLSPIPIDESEAA
jgi:hypothetical protein